MKESNAYIIKGYQQTQQQEPPETLAECPRACIYVFLSKCTITRPRRYSDSLFAVKLYSIWLITIYFKSGINRFSLI